MSNGTKSLTLKYFIVKKILSDTSRDENILPQTIHMKISNSEFFPNYGIWCYHAGLLCIWQVQEKDNRYHMMHQVSHDTLCTSHDTLADITWYTHYSHINEQLFVLSITLTSVEQVVHFIKYLFFYLHISNTHKLRDE